MRVYQFRHIRVRWSSEDIARAPAMAGPGRRDRRVRARSARSWHGCAPGALLASTRHCAPLSSRGLGRRPLMAETRVRIPVAVLDQRPRLSGAFSCPGSRWARLDDGAFRAAHELSRRHLDGRVRRRSASVGEDAHEHGTRAAEPSIVPEQETGCLIQRGRIRLTQCPLATLARPDAPPLSLGRGPTQCTDHLKLELLLLWLGDDEQEGRGRRT